MRQKLLLADDSVTIQRVVELTFSGEGIDVVAVGDGEQAIARIPTEKPDIVLADIAMPKKNGYDVAAFVKEHPTLSHVPVLLLAGAFEPVDEERARRVKSDGVLVKPFETHEVVARVRELIGGGTASPRLQPVAPATPPAPAEAGDILEWTDPSRSDESLDEYFDRLDAAFTKRTPTPVAAAAEPQEAESGDAPLPTFDTLLNTVTAMTPAEHPRPFPHLAPPQSREAGAQRPSQQAPDDEEADGNLLADLFHLLLEVEQGERDAASIRTPPGIDRLRKRNTIE